MDNLYENDFMALIKNRLGIVIHTHQRNDLKKTITEACNHFKCSPKDYLKMLKECPENSPLLEKIIIGITIGETYFFRDNHQMQLLQDTVLPIMIKRKREQGNLSLRIWSAGCASGEEIYTIAMMILELLKDIKSWKLHFLGSDINTHVLKKALAAEYSEWSMRSISDHFKKNYFQFKNNRYALSPTIRDMVEFKYINLRDNTYPSILTETNAQDLILCRNVLIYFDNEFIPNVMHKLSACLVEEGQILLGASDPINISGSNLISHSKESLLFSHRSTKKYSIPEKPLTSFHRPPIKNTVILKKSIDAELDKITKLINQASWEQALNSIDNCLQKKNENIFPFKCQSNGIGKSW